MKKLKGKKVNKSKLGSIPLYSLLNQQVGSPSKNRKPNIATSTQENPTSLICAKNSDL